MRTSSKLVIVAAAVIAVLGLGGCGEREQVVVYKQGKYQGKPDAKPWENAQWNKNQVQWETALKTRNLSQNEYTRAE